MRKKFSYTKVIILLSILLVNGLYSVTIFVSITNPPLSSNALTASFSSLEFLPTPLPFQVLSAYIYNHSAILYGVWRNISTTGSGRTILRLDFNKNFTKVNTIERFDIDFLENTSIFTNYSISSVITDGPEFYLLADGYGQNLASLEIVGLNSSTLAITETHIINCTTNPIEKAAIVPVNYCDADEMAIWNDSLWILVHFAHLILNNSVVVNVTASSQSLLSFNLLPFSFKSNYTITGSFSPAKPGFAYLISGPDKLYFNFPIFRYYYTSQSSNSYVFDPVNQTLIKMAWTETISQQNLNNLTKYDSVLNNDFLASSGLAIEFLGTLNDYFFIGYSLWTISPTLPPLPIVPIVLNSSIYILAVVIMVRSEQIKKYGKAIMKDLETLVSAIRRDH